METCTKYLSQLTDKELIDLARQIGMNIPELNLNKCGVLIGIKEKIHTYYNDTKKFRFEIKTNPQSVTFKSEELSGVTYTLHYAPRQSLSIDDFGGHITHGFDAKQGADGMILSKVVKFDGAADELSGELLKQARSFESRARRKLKDPHNLSPMMQDVTQREIKELEEWAKFYRTRANYITTIALNKEQTTSKD